MFVPWVLQKQQKPGSGSTSRQSTPQTVPEEQHEDRPPQVFNRYYHMFAKGELTELVTDAAKSLGLQVGSCVEGMTGIEITQEGWERSNYYVELRRWQSSFH